MPKRFGSIPQLPAVATPAANPPAGAYLLYYKPDGKLYRKDSTGVEVLAAASIDHTHTIDERNIVGADAATTAALVYPFLGTATIDNAPVQGGDRVLVKDQTGSSAWQNGVWSIPLGATAGSGAWTRNVRFDDADDMAGNLVRIERGTVNGGTVWTTSFKTSDTLGTDPVNWYRVLDTRDIAPDDSGWLTTGITANTGTAPQGTTITSQRRRRIGRWVDVRLSGTSVNQYSIPADGDHTNLILCTFPAGWAPLGKNVYFSASWDGNMSMGRIGAAADASSTSQAVLLASQATGTARTYAAGAVWEFTAAYALD